MIERHELFDPELLLDYLLRVNEMLSERDMELWELMIGREGGGYVRSKPLRSISKCFVERWLENLGITWVNSVTLSTTLEVTIRKVTLYCRVGAEPFGPPA